MNIKMNIEMNINEYKMNMKNIKGLRILLKELKLKIRIKSLLS